MDYSLFKIKLKKNKNKNIAQWKSYLNDNLDACKLALQNEKITIEGWFLDVIDTDYWLFVFTKAQDQFYARSVSEKSQLEIDLYNKVWKKENLDFATLVKLEKLLLIDTQVL